MPVFTNSQQVTLVLQSLLLGVGIGAVYDMLRHCVCISGADGRAAL